MRILFVASECYPLIKTGGLADVVGALPLALGRLGGDVRVMIPAYRGVVDKLDAVQEVATYGDVFGGPGRLLLGTTRDGLKVMALEAPHLYDRPGSIYVGPEGRDWSDNPRRFAALGAIGASVARFGASGWHPDVVHAHDWQAGLTPAYLAVSEDPHPPVVFTIHNVAFQGVCSASEFAGLGLPSWFFSPGGVEFYGNASFMKAGLVFADRLTTVSPTYARELRTPEFGLGMEGILNERAEVLSGIVNGIDDGEWDPETDPLLPAVYSARRPQGKARCKAEIQRRLGLADDPEALLFCVVSRLTGQKGLDLVLPHLDSIVARGGQLAVLGTGEPGLERHFTEAAARYPGRVAAVIGYDEVMAHGLQGGADAILIPSRFEPCGLTQLYGLRYGTLPIVSRTGGLADTVIDANEAAVRTGTATGIQFSPVTAAGLGFALERAFDLWADKKTWKKIQAKAMAHPVGWESSAAEYMALYDDLLGTRSV
ncbi:glycogen synthase GlgA [Mongoliimonas terrestris]|uniref:glycogen synthase GlgA n=1 Tax=Mongoliimonas terrestris TaxID=1709001 RepID=UPI0009495371|nr:glycogen synthase GlgA [Mongoliimonas terrestris]